MPSEQATSTVAIVLSRSKVDAPLFGQYVGSETVISKKHGGGWLYILKSDAARSFDAFEDAVNGLDAHLQMITSQTASFFLPVDSQTNDKILIGVAGSPFMNEIFDKRSGLFKKYVEVWRMQSTVPPRKRVVGSPDTLLIPGLKRLSRQLHVDFAINIHGSEGKRKREQRRSVYEEASINHAEKLERLRQKRMKLKNDEDTSETSSDYSESDDSIPKTPPKKIPTPQKMMDILTTAHAAALASKDDVIKSMLESHTAALAAKDALISTLIEALKK